MIGVCHICGKEKEVHIIKGGESWDNYLICSACSEERSFD